MGPERLPRLAHPYLHAGIVYEAVFAANQIIAKETGVFADLFAPLDLRLGEVAHVERVEFAAVGADNSRAIAQQFTGTRGREKPDLGAGKFIFVACRPGANEFGDRFSHDRVVAVFSAKPIYL